MQSLALQRTAIFARMTAIDVRLLGSHDIGVLDRVAEGVFDCPVDARWARAFFADGRHHLVVALDAGVIVGRMLAELLTLGRALGCTEAWLGTEEDNVPARRLYESGGGAPEPFIL